MTLAPRRAAAFRRNVRAEERRSCRRGVIRVGISLLLIGMVASPRALEEDGQAWFNTTAIVGLGAPAATARWSLWLEGQARLGEDAGRLSQYILRPGIGLRLGDAWSAWAGYARIGSERPFAARATDEDRGWQQLLWSGRGAGFDLTSRTRLEQRWVETGDDTGWRLRQFARASHPLRAASPFAWVGWDEVFVDLNDTDWGADAGLRQNRLFAGIAWTAAPGARLEVGYLNVWSLRARREDTVNHVASFSLFLRY